MEYILPTLIGVILIFSVSIGILFIMVLIEKILRKFSRYLRVKRKAIYKIIRKLETILIYIMAVLFTAFLLLNIVIGGYHIGSLIL